MKLYDMTGAPNPRRVRIFAAEKGIDLELVNVDMSKGEHKTPEFLKKHPSGKIPALETDDGRFIGESVAICRYLEALFPEPNLFGATPYELGRVEMHNRILELEFWTQVGISWVNGPVVAKMAEWPSLVTERKWWGWAAECMASRAIRRLPLVAFLKPMGQERPELSSR